MIKRYNPKLVEKKWQAYWSKHKTFVTKDKSKKPEKYVLTEFPYPSGEGLHMGHLRPYVAGDVYSRFARLQGFETMFPMGWDAFGLPAENFAIKHKMHPSVSTARNVKNAKNQLNSWGMGFDWSREINSTDPTYYKWTQWIFLQFYKAGLAYEATGLINWCPKDKTGLANEEVIDGRCERCGSVVQKKEMRQWYLKITAYAEKLLEGLKKLPEWPEAVKLQQANWIGKSLGAEIEFPVVVQKKDIKRFVILHGRGGTAATAFEPWLKKELGKKGYEVQTPTMPQHKGEPDDKEQMEFVKRNCTLDEQTVVVGHSFGGVVALRLLESGIKLNQVILVGTPYSGKFLDNEPRPTVKSSVEKGFDFSKIVRQAKSFIALYDAEDYVIPLSDGEAFAKKLSATLIKTRGQKPHFMNSVEPAVLQAIMPSVKVFTTRPDTIFGGTFLVLAPEHPIVQSLQSKIENLEEVKKYIEATKKKSDLDRTSEGKEKTGVELKGIRAINPATKQEIPLWVADFVLVNYGTGAVFADAHDERDFEFAKKYNIPLKTTLKPVGLADDSKIRNLEEPFTDKGILYDSGKFSGMTSDEAIPKMSGAFGKITVQYKLRDWVFSRQRYWGEPIPIIHCPKCGAVPVPEKDLPVKLPPVKKYQPTGTGESPLAAIKPWVNVKCPKCKGPAKRETNTMPQWAGSSWYYLRYTDPKNNKQFAKKELLKHWLPVDVYFGGTEHTTLHLLYSRFWNLFLHDQGRVPVSEPYERRVPHGIILAADGEKMSKSRGNVVNPDDIIKKFGADTLRMYELFLGPHEDTVSWNDKGIVGVKRFLDRVWMWAMENQESRIKNYESSAKVKQQLNWLIKKTTEDIENFRFNTAVSAFMQFHNQIKDEPIGRKDLQAFLTLLYPFAPHISEELNQLLGGKKSLQLEAWPKHDPSALKTGHATIIVQVNGKMRDKLIVESEKSENEIKMLALNSEKVKNALAGQPVKKVIFVPGRLINLVI